MKRIFSLILCLTLAIFIAGTAMARTLPVTEQNFTKTNEMTKAENTAARADTVFLFPSSGPGAWGTPGTNNRGFTFDGGAGVAATAGFTTYDNTAQDGDWWHIESTALCAGHATDMSGAIPFAGGDNNYALWCGRMNVCGWDNPNGYGDNWEQYVVLDCGDWDTSAQVQFEFVTDYEADDCDWFQVVVELDGEWEVLQDWMDAGAQPLRVADITVEAASYPGQVLGDLALHFTADGGWSSQTPGFPNDMGPVWVDNVILTVDDVEVGRSDFEDHIQPAWMDFTSPEGAGAPGELRSNLFSEDICTLNPTFAWAFYDPETMSASYPIPVVVYGPPYIDTGIQSPILDETHHLGDAEGQPLEITTTSSIILDYWVYRDMPLNTLIFYKRYVSAATEERPCLGPFETNSSVYYGDEKAWDFWTHDVTLELVTSADGGVITGIAVRLGVLDLCEDWCNENGDGTGHTPAPYFDNIEIKLVDDSAVAWNVDGFRMLQDNFPGPNGYVRIDNSCDIAPLAADLMLPGDSTLVSLNMDLLGGIQTHVSPEAGEVRPNFYMYFRVTAGPNEGSVDPMMSDIDDEDGVYTPIIGTTDFFGSTWNCVEADSAQNNDVITDGTFAFDLNEEFFQAGDIIRYFYWAEAVDGTVETKPKNTLSTNPDLRTSYILRCLPTAGVEMLFVNDGNVRTPWSEAFKYNGYTVYDTYYVQAPSSCMGNGLAGRANYDDIAQYRTMVWDSGDLPSCTITSAVLGNKVFDDVLLDEWLNQHDHDAFLWIMGDELAADVTNAVTFLNVNMGVEVLSEELFYDDYTSILVPKVFATHPTLEYLGGTPDFWVDGGCPTIQNFSAIQPIGDLAEVAFEWEATEAGMVAGIVNYDPDANGEITSPSGYANRVLYNAFSYLQVLDAGYALASEEDYARRMVGHVLTNMLGTVADGAPIGVDETPAMTRLNGNYPNPFNPTTVIALSLASAEHVSLSVYDISGRLVKSLVNNKMIAGDHEVVWNGKDSNGERVASGVYFYKMSAGDYTATDKMILLK
ncbi:MAG: T9SS type A sorting domain-containing protein [bacterium]|nr:T9SS type A sorting domain-containing protein [bacterium]